MKYRRQKHVVAERASELSENAETQDENANNKYHFFWKNGSPFSQWHPSKYELNGFEYHCAEQGMMHGKALLFEDEATAKLIMQTTSPHEMKKLGKLVKGFKEKKWNKSRENIVYMNSMAKFIQNDNFQEALISTTGYLVEASPSDKIWGIGLNENRARNTPEDRWPGKNLLGKILTRVREDIRQESYEEKCAEKAGAETYEDDGDDGDDHDFINVDDEYVDSDNDDSEDDVVDSGEEEAFS